VRRADFAILGAGALGSIVAAHLSNVGHSVIVLARGTRASVVRREGLRIEGLVDLSVPVGVVSDPGERLCASTLIVATKAIGTAAALAQLTRAEIETGVSLQNGVQKDELVSAALGDARTLSAAAYISGELQPSGAVAFTRRFAIVVGELGNRATGRADRLVNDLVSSGLPARAVPDVERYIWSKFAAWVGFASLSVTTRECTGAFLSNPAAAGLFVRLVKDVQRLALSRGVALIDDPSLPIARICEADPEEARRLVVDAGQGFLSTAPHHRVSSLQDFEAGRPLELDETIGHAVHMARQGGIALPTLEAIHDILVAVDQLRRREA
jgi:2-dehydropantoate 2-reductase